MRIYDRQPLFKLTASELIDILDHYEKRKITGQKKQAIIQELRERGFAPSNRNPEQLRGSAPDLTSEPPAFDFSTHTTEQLQKRLRQLLQSQRVTDATDAQAHAIDRELKRRQMNTQEQAA